MQNQNLEPGRKGLFSLTEKKDETPVKCYSGDELKIIVETILSDNKDLSGIPDLFKPVTQKFQSDSENISQKKGEIERIEEERNFERTNLQTELNILKTELEKFSEEMIAAQTSLDRVLEFYQYHIIPMALLGSGGKLLDANDAFCTLFSLTRSGIVSEKPDLNRYIPETTHFSTPDGNEYYKLSISPPIIPSGNEAASLDLLVKINKEQRRIKPGCLPEGHITDFMNNLPFAMVIIDDNNTVRYTNQAMVSLLGRRYNEILYRDISSIGLNPEISNYISNIDNPVESDAGIKISITFYNGTEKDVFIQGFNLNCDDTRYTIIIALPDDDEISDSQEKKNIIFQDETEKSFVEQKRILKTLLDINPSPVILFNSNGEILITNEGVSELIGVSSDQLVGQKLNDIGIRLPDIKQDKDTIEVLSDKIHIESPYGVQEYSAILISEISGDDNNFILILQSANENSMGLQVETQNKPLETDVLDVLPVSKLKNQDDITTDVSIVDSLLSILPVISMVDGKIGDMNNNFLNWSGTSENDFSPDLVNSLVSNMIQSSEKPDNVFSTLFPSGLKYYRMIYIPDENSPRSGTGLIIDISNEYNKISVLENENNQINKEIQEIKSSKPSETQKQHLIDELSSQVDIVEFELAGGRYAMDIGMVREVVEMLPITPIPKTPPYIIGIINLRGEVTHIIDLGILLGEGLRKDRSGQKIIIVPPDAAHGEHLGIIVDNVRSVTEIGVKQVTSLGDDINNRIQTTIKGVIKITHDELTEKHEDDLKEDNLVIWLDMEDILKRLSGYR